MAEVSWLSEYKSAAAGAAPPPPGRDVLGLVRAGVACDAGLPGPDEDQGWQDRALCAETDPEAFFPEKGGSTREAKKICTGCEVRAECLEYALANDERFGIWGGLSERERRRLRRRVG
jgi:WhiB family redox-sensing transcriptional regulator